MTRTTRPLNGLLKVRDIGETGCRWQTGGSLYVKCATTNVCSLARFHLLFDKQIFNRMGEIKLVSGAA
jgi:hypothetical protein